jgi:hypothetical protein
VPWLPIRFHLSNVSRNCNQHPCTKIIHTLHFISDRGCTPLTAPSRNLTLRKYRRLLSPTLSFLNRSVADCAVVPVLTAFLPNLAFFGSAHRWGAVNYICDSVHHRVWGDHPSSNLWPEPTLDRIYLNPHHVVLLRYLPQFSLQSCTFLVNPCFFGVPILYEKRSTCTDTVVHFVCTCRWLYE